MTGVEAENRFDMRDEGNGYRSVYDIFTGQPAETKGVFLSMCAMEEADDLVDLFDAEYIDCRKGTTS